MGASFMRMCVFHMLLVLVVVLLGFMTRHDPSDERCRGYAPSFSISLFTRSPASSSETIPLSSLMPEQLAEQKEIVGKHPDGTPIDITDRKLNWYDQLLDVRDSSLGYMGYSTIRYQIETARKEEIYRLDQIRLEQAKRVAAERMARELDAKARRAREEYERAKEAKEKEVLERIQQEKREEDEMKEEELKQRIHRARGNYETADNATFGCPVCERIIRTVRRSARDEKNILSQEISSFDTKGSKSSHEIRTSMVSSDQDIFIRYCKLSKLPVEEKKFCYDTETSRKEIFRLLDLGADDKRICRKIKKINPDFCNSSQGQVNVDNSGAADRAPSTQQTKNFTRGVIYI